ncbi:MAG TPA: mannose-1-phosphate guanylyltransferase [Chthoniobacteraceae bacterium]|jgi:mannose-1-phosphate guanylyltransferase
METRPLYVLILAGGSGERFWPLSRRARPKQLLALFSEQTLLQSTVSRLSGLVETANILILTNQDQEAGVRALLPHLPEENIVAEPAKRDTAAAIALGVGWVAARAPGATMVVLPADHLIQDSAGFQRTLRTAAAAAEETGELVTIGIAPTWACPGFGYIEQGAPAALSSTNGGPEVFNVTRFREKPTVEQAETFLQQGNFRWNAGMFIWTIAAIREALERDAPALGEYVQRLSAGESFSTMLADVFPTLPKISVDYAILEKAPRVLVVEAAFDWDDVGTWTAVAKYLQSDEAGNMSNSPLQTLDAAGNIVFSEQRSVVALLGVQNLIVVQTKDALLVCAAGEAEKIKQLVAQVPPELQ